MYQVKVNVAIVFKVSLHFLATDWKEREPRAKDHRVRGQGIFKGERWYLLISSNKWLPPGSSRSSDSNDEHGLWFNAEIHQTSCSQWLRLLTFNILGLSIYLGQTNILFTQEREGIYAGPSLYWVLLDHDWRAL